MEAQADNGNAVARKKRLTRVTHEPMEDATDEETYNLLLQLKELRCARLQVCVTHVLARSHLLPLTPRCTPSLSLSCEGDDRTQGGAARGGEAS